MYIYIHKQEAFGKSTVICNYNYDVDNCQAQRLKYSGRDK